MSNSAAPPCHPVCLHLVSYRGSGVYRCTRCGSVRPWPGTLEEVFRKNTSLDLSGTALNNPHQSWKK